MVPASTPFATISRYACITSVCVYTDPGIANGNWSDNNTFTMQVFFRDECTPSPEIAMITSQSVQQ